MTDSDTQHSDSPAPGENTRETTDDTDGSSTQAVSVRNLLRSNNNVPSVIDKINWQEVKIIFFLGAVGGCVAGVLQVLDGASASTLQEHMGLILTFLTYPALGGIAAILGIYLVFGTPREDARRFVALSILCGMSFSYVFEASKQIISIQDIEQNLQAISNSQAVIQSVNPKDVTKETLDATVTSLSDNIAVIERLYLAAETPKEVRKIIQTTNLLKDTSSKLLLNKNISSDSKLLEKVKSLNSKVINLSSKLTAPAL